MKLATRKRKYWCSGCKRSLYRTSNKLSLISFCETAGKNIRIRNLQIKKRYKNNGITGSVEHNCWVGMMFRCENKRSKAYEHYGGRGINVCSRWHKYENFLADMGKRPDGMTLDRIDNDKGYSPENCRWATMAEQNLNKRNTRMLEFNGIRKPLVEWARELGINSSTINTRVNVLGWSVEKALTKK